MRRAAVSYLALVVLVAGTATVADSPAVSAGIAPMGVCATFEAAIDGVPAVANPFDPSQADVQVTFISPSGASSTIPAFFIQDFDHFLNANGREVLNPEGTGYWKVRFTPTEPGRWSRSTAVSINGDAPSISPTETFTCDADVSSHGFLRRSSDDPRQLRWEDGSPYLAIGENLAWYLGREGTFVYDVWLDNLAAHGATWIRVWMPSWAFGLETITRDDGGAIIQNSLGDYTTRLDRAWQLDYVIEAARARGIVVQLVFEYHGFFSTTTNSEWHDNPYNAANGGPLTDPTQIFTDDTAKELFARRMRYIVARWGYATNLVWEFWNEVELTNGAPADIIAWHVDMGDRLRALDPYDHLQTTSVNSDLLFNPTTWVPLFELPQIDLTQLHFYGLGAEIPLDFTTFVPLFAAPLLAIDKPMLAAELGIGAVGGPATIEADPTGQGFHELLWTGLFAGGYGSGMTWWWGTAVHVMDWYHILDGLHALTTGVAFDRQRFVRNGATAVTQDGNGLQAFPLRGHDTALVWIRNPANFWGNPDFATVAGATLTLDGFTDGEWHVQWVDPYSADETDGGRVSVRAGHASIAVPEFSRETALRLTLVRAQTTYVDCDQVAGTGKSKPGLTSSAQSVALSVSSSHAGSCTGQLVDQTGPLTALKGKLVGSWSCDASVADPLHPLAGKLHMIWTSLDSKGRPLKSSMFVRMRSGAHADALAVGKGIVIKGPGSGLDVSGSFLYQPTDKRASDSSTVDAAGNVVPGAASLSIATSCVTGAGSIESVVIGTDGTSLTGVPFDSSIAFSLPAQHIAAAASAR